MRIGIHSLTRALAAVSLLAGALLSADPALAGDSDTVGPVTERFAQESVPEVPSFQRHVSPLFGRLGCNGRACHGSFQGRGNFRLSLFGYDFKFDHDELLKGEPKRANAEQPLESLILVKPTDADMHEGGLRYKKGGWEYHVFRRWLEGGAKFDEADVQKLVTLDVQPAEILFASLGETVQLKAVAVWPDGTREDVTPLCRFSTNSEQVAKITADGLVTATDPGDTHLVVSYDNAVIPVPVIRPVSDQVGDKYPPIATPTKIDELVVQKLKKLGMVPADECTDAEFLRRVSLDLTGTLPTAAEVEAFLADTCATKRADKIEQLLNSPAYAAWWTTRLCDWTGNNDTKLNQQIGGNRGTASQQWYDWLYDRVAKNVSYDKIAEGFVTATSRMPGESYTEYCEAMSKLYRGDEGTKIADRPSMPYYWGRTGFLQPEERAIGFAYTFLGIRIQCAQCHKHPFDQWAKSDFDAFKAFFPNSLRYAQNGAGAQDEYKKMIGDLGLADTELRGNQLRNRLTQLVQEGKTIPFPELAAAVVRAQPANRRNNNNNNRNNRNATTPTAHVLGGEEVDLTKFDDARQPLMDWLRSKDNPYFAKAFVNRVWANYFNVGIVQPPDDMSLANPPSNKPLLDYLAQGFIEHGFDMKWVHREICNSRTYQLSWQPNETNAKDERNFARSVPRRLAAEVAVDAINAAVASDEKAATLLTTVKGRAIGVPGSNARANQGGNNNLLGFALQVFGRSIRESNCDCDRSMDASLLQTVYLQNDQAVLTALNGGKDTWIDQISQSKAPTTGAPERRGGAERDLVQLKVRLERVKKDGDEEQVKRIEARLAEVEAAVADRKQAQANPGGITLETLSLIRQSYLRTLSRNPSPDEIARCEQYLASAASPVEGAKGLLWTLINTKEFIVNH